MNSAPSSQIYNLLKYAPAAIAVLKGKQHVFEVANPLYMQLIGQDRDVIGKPLLEALPEIRTQGFNDILDRIYVTGERYTGDETWVQLDRYGTGELEDIYLNFVYQPIKDAQGQEEGVFVHAVEITEQVKARQKIQESEEKYRTLFETMDQGFCILEMIFDANQKPLDYRFLEINPVFEEQTGLKDAIGKTARELVPNLEEHWFEIYGQVALTGITNRFVQGSEAMGRWFDVFAFRLGGADSRKVALLFTNISERKRAEEERARLLAREHQAREEAEQATAQIAFLQKLTSAFAQSRYLPELFEILLHTAVPDMGAQFGAVFLLADDGASLRLAGHHGLNAALVPAIERLDLRTHSPATDSIRTEAPLWIENQPDLIALYPHLADLIQSRLDVHAVACIPLMLNGAVVEIGYTQPHTFTPQERGLLNAIADQYAQAVNRIRLLDKEQGLIVIEERHRLARELHDAVSQALFSVNVIAESIPRLWEQQPAKAFDLLHQLHRLSTGASAEMRTLLWELRPESITTSKLANLLTQLAYSAQARKDIGVALHIHQTDGVELPPDARLAFYRIAQESLNNILKHGNASVVRVWLRQTPTGTALVIRDNGGGFDTTAARSGFGLQNMQERADQINAAFSIKSTIGQGTRVRLFCRTTS